MLEFRRFLKRHPLWVGFLPVLAPMIVLLALQSWWLVMLRKTSATADRATLDTFRQSVVTDVLYTYGSSAERALNVPPPLVRERRLDSIASHFATKGFSGAVAHFLVLFGRGDRSEVLRYDPGRGTMVPECPCDMERAVRLASAPWLRFHEKGIEVFETRLTVEERDPSNRVVIYPIVDTNSRLAGVAAMVLDTEKFRHVVLPEIIESAMPKFFTPAALENVIVTVTDGSGALAWANEDPGDQPAEVSGPFSLVFEDWRLGVRSRYMSPMQWARTTYDVNLTITILTATVLALGILLAARLFSREMKLTRMKEDFVSNVSHELRTPVASIRVMGEFLREGRVRDAAKIREYGEYIESEGRRLTQLINNILDFSRIESGRKTYDFATGDVGDVVDAVLRTFHLRLKDSGYELEFHPPSDPLPMVRLDAHALSQALFNLLDNAIKYSGESRLIEVGLDRVGTEIVIRVRDHGVGITRQEQEKVFDRFHRVGTGLVHDIKGSGLGLAIVKHIVEAHGGRVTVESDPGRGSTFSIHLPAVGRELPDTGGEHVPAVG